MADEQNDIKLISRKNSGFPEWLDFDKLRREGIDYIGNLAGKIWTDHNVHDPGITTLEVLCYALLDLGYRTNLPAKDIFARDADDKNPDDNFLTPAEILTINPLTITDFRKLLIDIPGIKNAWLEVATDQQADDLCKTPEHPPENPNVILLTHTNTPTKEKDNCCIDYLNGLYHVYIDTEKNPDDEFPASEKEKRDCYVQALLQKVKDKLMSHRNICEDFVDVKILCKWKLGVCAEIELEEDADIENVYLEMIEKLRQFFSPSPRFYTLEQMLEKKKPIDEIFAGRPSDISESHGFIDTEELEKLELRKSIHVSDVYNVLFTIKGIRKVQRLRLINCKNSKKFAADWIVKIPENNVPDFDFKCSGFEFTRNQIPVSFDFEKYDALLEINFEHNGKILYHSPTNKLDLEIPKGTFHKELGAYSSIQNEFPRVYGIAEGGLPENAPALRKAQAHQFKGYLLFFDHLLASYLSQLQHIRSLFALRLPATKEDKINATYFSSVPGSVPDFQELIRYKIDNDSIAAQGETGFLAFPVSKSYFQNLVEHEKHKTIHLEKLPYFRFRSATEKNIAVAQLQDDMLNDSLEIYYVTKNDECVYYYVVSSSDDFVLVSRKYYKNEKIAMVAASSIKYAGTIGTNYRTSLSEVIDGFSFSVELNISGYASFLQQLTEDNTLYLQRRQGFLNHLLSRFAEKFTDFALLSYGINGPEKLQAGEIGAKAFYLSNYPLISSTRGKAFDYTLDGWHTNNNSGFEKKFRGLLGHEELKRKTLCNFEVYDYGEKYIFQLRLSSGLFIKTNEKFNTRNEAADAAHELFKSLALRSSYHTAKLPYQDNYRVQINYARNKEAWFNTHHPNEQEAEKAANYLYKLIAIPQANGKIEVNSYRYKEVMTGEDGKPFSVLSETFATSEEAINAALKSINDAGKWIDTEKKTGKLLIHPSKEKAIRLIDESLFKVDIDNREIGKPHSFNYYLLDQGNHFLFRSFDEFDNDKKAREACNYTKRLLADENNLTVEQLKDEKSWSVFINEEEKTHARSSATAQSKHEAEKIKDEIWEIIKQHVYLLKTEAIPETWKFRYTLGFEEGKTFFIDSAQIYDNKPEAESALVDFSNSISKSHIETAGKEWHVSYKTGKEEEKIILGILHVGSENEKELAEHWLDAVKEINRIRDAEYHAESYSPYVEVHEDNQCRFVYHLADKDGLYAIYKKSFSTKEETKKTLVSELIKDSHEYFFPELQMHGNIGDHIDQETKTKWHHYQLKTTNYVPNPKGVPAKRLVLFESVQGYESEEEVAKAFAENFMEILFLASDINNYGENKPISEKQIFNHRQDDCINKDVMAYIPRETMGYLGDYPQQSIEAMINIVLRYPVRMIRKERQADEFNERFSYCDQLKNEENKACEKFYPKEKKECYSKDEKPVYYFILYNKKTKAFDNNKVQVEDWQSVEYFDGHNEAMKAFRFFYLLLNHEANYTSKRDCTGNIKIYIREVLAESNYHFYGEQHAWGKEGVQKFIQVSQIPCSFHAYTDEHCCNRFFLACKNIHIIHPCKYDSPEIRDKVIHQLQHFLSSILNWKFDFCDQQWDKIIYDFEQNKICSVEIKGSTWQPSNKLDGYATIYSLVNNYPLCIVEDENLIRLEDGKGLIIDFHLQAGIYIQSLKELKEKLQWLACYFPFYKNEEKNGLAYCIEIRLPGFNGCERCNEEVNESCPVAWTNDCCYADCKELLTAYHQTISWLKKFSSYKAVFDCPCGQYGIELYDDTPGCIGFDMQPTTADLFIPRIVAHSPQCYTSAEMVCDAIERAKKLINSEGLHLVEHILLRPHCKEDCDCLVEPCRVDPYHNCIFPNWKIDNDDPCDETEPVCFKPAKDPYSFIATVALPAWPERFRKPGNQVIIENMLYREAPAHVALRILWLTPHDLCCFENYFRKWMMWTAYKQTRTDYFVPCDFTNLLFNREFECWKDYDHCPECAEEKIQPESCVQIIRKEEEKNKPGICEVKNWNEQITELFCWKGKDCDKDYIECKPEAKEKEPPVEIIEHNIEDTGMADAVLTEPQKTSIQKERDQFLNSRRTTRKKSVDSLVMSTGENEHAKKTRSFLDSGTPSDKSFNKLLSDLMKETDKKLKKELVTHAVHFYLDKKAFADDEPDFKNVHSAFEKLRENKIDLEKIYKKWEPEKAKKFLTVSRFNKIENLFRK